MQLVAGRNFDATLASDSMNAVIVNEELVHTVLGTTAEKALGKQLTQGKGNRPPKTIIGISRNFNFEDLTRQVRPQLFTRPAQLKPTRIYVRLEAGDPASKLTMLGNT